MHMCAAMTLHAKLSRQCACMQCTACCARLPATLVLTCSHILPPCGQARQSAQRDRIKSILEASNSVRPSFSCRSLSLIGLRGHGQPVTASVFLANTPRVAADTHGCCYLFAHAARGSNHAADTTGLAAFQTGRFFAPGAAPASRRNEH